MAVYHDLKAIFIHIPKTGGQSVHYTLPGGEHKNKHFTAVELRDIIGPDQFAQYFSFATIRNPFDRMVSLFHFRRQDYVAPSVDDGVFAQWINDIYSPEADRERLIHRLNEHRYWHCNQLNWVRDENGDILVDRLLRFEHLEREWASIAGDINFSSSLPHANRSRRRHYSHYYDRESKELVAQHYAEDIEHFGFTF